MLRRLAIGTLAAAMLLGSSVASGAVDRTQAQTVDCGSWQGRGAACAEEYFNMNPPAGAAVQSEPRSLAGQAARATQQIAQTTAQASSQAAPQPTTQAEGSE